MKSTGLRLSPCEVPMEVANPWQPPVERSARSRCRRDEGEPPVVPSHQECLQRVEEVIAADSV